KAASGDPKVQVLLIPSWGMTIGGGDCVSIEHATKPGLVFNVDGSRCDSDARATDGTYSCDRHPQHQSATEDPCPVLIEKYVCEPCNSVMGERPGTCDDGHAP